MLPDLLVPGLQVIFCGTAAGHASARAGHYYAGPGNRFWQMLAETGLTPYRLRPDQDHLMPGFGYGLTDLAKEVSGMDRDIPPNAYAPARLARIVAAYQPKRLAFTSLTAAKIALGQRHAPGRTRAAAFPDLPLWVLPSPSGAARGHFRAAPWADLAQDIKGQI